MKQYSPAAERNQGPIFEVLDPLLPFQARVLEVASGTGQHAQYMCQHRQDIIWQATDHDPQALESIRAYQQEQLIPGFLAPEAWSILEACPALIQGSYHALVNINMIHIAPWEAARALFSQAAQLLKPQGLLFLYGPFLVENQITAPSNISFNQSLLDRNQLWGLRNLERVVEESALNGLEWQETIAMPAHNLSVLFRRK